MEQREAGRIRNLGFSFHGDVAVFDWLLEHHEQYHWDFVQIQANYCDWHNDADRSRSGEYLYGQLVKRSIPAVIMEPSQAAQTGEQRGQLGVPLHRQQA